MTMGMLRTPGTLATILGLFAAAAAMAVPAAADDPAPDGTVEGVYAYEGHGVSATWQIRPLCVPTVGAGRVPLNLAVACKLQVESNGPEGQSGFYRLVGGRWTYSNSLLAGKKCDDGKWAATREQYVFDTSLSGTYSQAHNAICGEQPGIDDHPFTLTYVGPLPNPTIHYPLNCQDNPVHLCS